MSPEDLKIGEYRRHARLGTEAVYRVRELEGRLVLVEVVSAPGLRPGRCVRLTVDAVCAMTSLPGWEPENGSRPS